MAAARGSKQAIKVIKEVTFGTTPATPTMIEIPVVSSKRDQAIGLVESGQIRTHPFIDRFIKGVQKNDIDIVTEMQDDTHDVLLELLAGDVFTANTLKLKDVLSSFSGEWGATDLTLFDQFTGCCVRRAEFGFQAAEDAKVTATYGVMAKSGSLDAVTSLATTTTPAPNVDPFGFADATVTIGGSARPVTAGSITVERQIDPLYVLGQRTARDYIPSTVTVSGSITVPYEDALESARLSAFAAIPLVFKAGDNGATNFRQFTIPGAYYESMGRSLQNRGVLLQEINWRARYDSASGTVMSITRSA
jgi:hypothetical protein